MLVLDDLEPAVAHHDRVLVSCVRRGHFAGTDLEDTQPDCDKHLHLIIRTKGFIGFGQNLARRPAKHRAALQNDLGDHHKQRCRHAFSADVRHDDAQMIFIDQEKVVEVAADFSGRIHDRIDVEFFSLREGRENAGQHALLDLVRHLQLRADPLLLRCYRLNFVQIQDGLMGQFGEGLSENFDLIPRPILIPHGKFQVVLTQRGDLACYVVERLYNSLTQNQRPGQHEDRHQKKKDHDCPSGSVEFVAIGLRGFVLNSLVIIAKCSNRRFRKLLFESCDQRPANRFHRHADHIIGAVIHVYQTHIGLGFHGVHYQSCKFFVRGLAQVSRFCGVDHPERAFGFGRKDDMSVVVDHAIETAVLLRSLHSFLHGSEEKVRSDNGCQLAVNIYRHRADNADITGKRVDFNISEDQFSCFHSHLIPGAGARVIADQSAVRVVF